MEIIFYNNNNNNNNKIAPALLDQYLGQAMNSNRTLTPETIMFQTAMFGGGGYQSPNSSSNFNSNSTSNSSSNWKTIFTDGGYWNSRGIF